MASPPRRLVVCLSPLNPTICSPSQDGAESLIPGMKNMIDVAADLGVGYMVIGMAHRSVHAICQQQLSAGVLCTVRR